MPTSERGVGAISALIGVVMFLMFCLAATQVTISLYARSTLSAVAYDAARAVATQYSGCGASSATTHAEGRARQQLGQLGQRAEFTWSCTGSAVTLTINVDLPNVLPPAWGRATGTDFAHRTATVRVEAPAQELP